MNENQQNIQETMETLPSDSGISFDTDNVNRINGSSVSNTSIADIDGTGTYSEADTSSPNVWTSGYSNDSDSISGGDILADSPFNTQELMAIQEVVTENEAEIVQNLSAIHSVLVLILAFLLFEWTEKKLKVTVNRFADKRSGNIHG